MSSGLVVDNITNSLGTSLISNGQVNFAGRPGTVLEYITGLCDGSSHQGVSGTYTFENVTSIIDVTTTYQDVTGSTISYTPPTGTKKVVFKMNLHWHAENYSGITHFKTFLDGTEIIPSYRDHAASYSSSAHGSMNVVLETVIDCASTNNLAYGKLSSWTTAKTFKIQVRDYDDSTYQASIHKNTWRDGAGASAPYTIAVPTLTIIALS